MQRAGTTSETKSVSSQFALYLNLNLFFILCFCNKLERVVVAFYATYKYLEWSCTHSKKILQIMEKNVPELILFHFSL